MKEHTAHSGSTETICAKGAWSHGWTCVVLVLLIWSKWYISFPIKELLFTHILGQRRPFVQEGPWGHGWACVVMGERCQLLMVPAWILPATQGLAPVQLYRWPTCLANLELACTVLYFSPLVTNCVSYVYTHLVYRPACSRNTKWKISVWSS